MVIVKTTISVGYMTLLDAFFKANNLEVKMTDRSAENMMRHLINIEFEENSDTAHQITFMSYRHQGFENMLCDYLHKCGVPLEMIAVGHQPQRNRDMKKLDEAWEEYRKTLGFK